MAEREQTRTLSRAKISIFREIRPPRGVKSSKFLRIISVCLSMSKNDVRAIHYLYIRARADGVAVYSITMLTISHAAFRPAALVS